MARILACFRVVLAVVREVVVPFGDADGADSSRLLPSLAKTKVAIRVRSARKARTSRSAISRRCSR